MGLFDVLKRSAVPAVDEISHAELVQALAAKSCALVDVREPQEFGSGHIAGATNMPLSRFDAARLPKGEPVVLICRSGARSASALARARAQGRADIRHYRGGVIGWANAGGELVRD